MMTDDVKAVVWEASFLPFGAVDTLSGPASLDCRFPGQWFQLESGLHYNWHRHYDPTTGRYLQPDPLGMPDGPNRWAYVLNSPLMYTDRQGLWAWWFIRFASLLLRSAPPVVYPLDPMPISAPYAPTVPDDLPGSCPAPRGILHMNGGEGEETRAKPPAGSRPISQTPWSGDHEDIKGGIGAGPADDTRIDPDGNVWSQNPDGSWTNHGHAGTGSGRPLGRRSRDRRW